MCYIMKINIYVYVCDMTHMHMYIIRRGESTRRDTNMMLLNINRKKSSQLEASFKEPPAVFTVWILT